VVTYVWARNRSASGRNICEDWGRRRHDLHYYSIYYREATVVVGAGCDDERHVPLDLDGSPYDPRLDAGGD
jgi:hypothetical protein